MKRKILINIFVSVSLFVLGTSLVYAQGSDRNVPVVNQTIPNPLKTGDNIYTLLMKIVDEVLIPIGGIVAVLMFIWAGFMFVSAAGNSTEINKAKDALLYAAVGTAILLGAKGILLLLTNTINSLKT